MTAPTINRNAAKKPLISGRRPDLTKPLHHRFNAPVGNKPYERNNNIERDRDPGLNNGQQHRRCVDR